MSSKSFQISQFFSAGKELTQVATGEKNVPDVSQVLEYDSNLDTFKDTFVLPVEDGQNGFLMTTDGGGNTSFSDLSRGTLTKSFDSGEEYSITLSSPITPMPNISVSKEIPSENFVTKSNWDVDATASNYERRDYKEDKLPSDLVVTLSNTDSDGTYTVETAGSYYYSTHSAVYDDIRFNPFTGDTNPYGLYFKKDGTKFYVSTVSQDKVYQYSMSTPWDIANAVFEAESPNLNSGNAGEDPYALTFKEDGTVMYVAWATEIIHPFNLSTPWDVSTATYDLASRSPSLRTLGNTAVSNLGGIAFKPDGTKLITGSVSTRRFHSFDLSTPWDLTTVTYDTEYMLNGTSTSNGAQSVYNMYVTEDGRTLIAAHINKVYRYQMDTPWDISTMYYAGGDDISHVAVRGVSFNSDGSKMYLGSTSTDDLRQYSTFGPISADLSENHVGKVVAGNGGVAQIDFTPTSFFDKKYILKKPFTGGATLSDWALYGLQADTTKGVTIPKFSETFRPDYINTAVAAQVPGQGRSRVYGFNGDGTRLIGSYEANGGEQTVWQYWDLSVPYDLGSYTSVNYPGFPSETDLSTTNESLVDDGEYKSVVFKPDGSGFFISGMDYTFNSSGSPGFYKFKFYIMEFACTNFDFTNYTFVEEYVYDTRYDNGNSVPSGPYINGLDFNGDGTKLFATLSAIGSVSSLGMREYALSTPYSLNGIILTTTHTSIGGTNVSNATCAIFNSDGTKLFLRNPSSGALYSLSVPYDVSTATELVPYSSTLKINSSTDTEDSIIVAPDDTTFIFADYSTTSNPVKMYTGAIKLVSPEGNIPYVAVTNSSGKINTNSWGDINEMTADEIVPANTNAYYAVSTDGRVTWKVISDSNGIRSIARNNAGVWEYNSDAIYTSETWTTSTINEEIPALEQALSVSANQMESAQLNSVSDPNHFPLGTSLDLMIGLKVDTTLQKIEFPSSDAVTIDYTGAIIYRQATPGIDYDADVITTTEIKIKSLRAQNLKLRVV